MPALVRKADGVIVDISDKEFPAHVDLEWVPLPEVTRDHVGWRWDGNEVTPVAGEPRGPDPKEQRLGRVEQAVDRTEQRVPTLMGALDEVIAQANTANNLNQMRGALLDLVMAMKAHYAEGAPQQ